MKPGIWLPVVSFAASLAGLSKNALDLGKEVWSVTGGGSMLLDLSRCWNILSPVLFMGGIGGLIYWSMAKAFRVLAAETKASVSGAIATSTETKQMIAASSTETKQMSAAVLAEVKQMIASQSAQILAATNKTQELADQLQGDNGELRVRLQRIEIKLGLVNENGGTADLTGREG